MNYFKTESKISTSTSQLQHRNLILLLRFVCVSLLLGRAWQCFRWETAISNVVLDPNGMGKLLESVYAASLHEIYSNRLAENLIVGIDYVLGSILLIGALTAIFFSQKRTWLKWFLYLSVIGLILIHFAEFYNKNFYTGLLLEHSLQIASPVFLLMAVRGNKTERTLLFIKIATAITFVCHGLFAVGYYPVPGYFVDMMIKGFGMDESLARNSLLVLGILDFVFAAAIFIRPVIKPALLYGILWGFLTALARIYTTFDADFFGNWFSQYFFEFLVRFSHFIAPLILLLYVTNRLDRFPFRQR